ncbi:hypothetical protein [Arthrobacter sp. BL-252-APC-1A]|uniref:hypothetical protein n=1 Tax=Arthrobacter TaxID=1663 RepID=UPI0012B1BD72|nr:hypothetical protein [Arthrobacter sp. BL-252-APC-1A]MSR99952.1 hypothetical protein [Arthrobacter sp. BL-252-APC-1A]
MQPIRIERWWPYLDTTAKQWLRENLRQDGIPPKVQDRIAEAGGPVIDPILGGQDWDFIETQSELVD